jgi:hypothetical protein
MVFYFKVSYIRQSALEENAALIVSIIHVRVQRVQVILTLFVSLTTVEGVTLNSGIIAGTKFNVTGMY